MGDGWDMESEGARGFWTPGDAKGAGKRSGIPERKGPGEMNLRTF